MKTYAPKSLRGYDLRRIMEEMAATPAQVAKFLEVTERSVWRWLANDSAPRAVLCALWHETARGREVSANDVGFDLQLTRMGERLAIEARTKQAAQLGRLLAISDTGAANDPLVAGPWALRPLPSSVVNFGAVPHFDDGDRHNHGFDFGDDAVIAHTVAP